MAWVTFITAGMPYSRAMIAPWERRPPTSAMSPPARASRGKIDVYVVTDDLQSREAKVHRSLCPKLGQWDGPKTADAEFAHKLAADLRGEGWRVWIAPDSGCRLAFGWWPV